MNIHDLEKNGHQLDNKKDNNHKEIFDALKLPDEQPQSNYL